MGSHLITRTAASRRQGTELVLDQEEPSWPEPQGQCTPGTSLCIKCLMLLGVLSILESSEELRRQYSLIHWSSKMRGHCQRYLDIWGAVTNTEYRNFSLIFPNRMVKCLLILKTSVNLSVILHYFLLNYTHGDILRKLFNFQCILPIFFKNVIVWEAERPRETDKETVLDHNSLLKCLWLPAARPKPKARAKNSIWGPTWAAGTQPVDPPLPPPRVHTSWKLESTAKIGIKNSDVGCQS